MISYILQFLIKKFGLSGSPPDSVDYVCQIESGLTEVYCIFKLLITSIEKQKGL